MTGRYARETTVSEDRSRLEIERTLERYGADQFGYVREALRAEIAFRLRQRTYRFRLPMPDRDDPRFTSYRQGRTDYLRTESAARELYEKEVRQRWRALALVIKATLEAAELGILTIEDAFMASTVMPDGSRFGDWAEPQIRRTYLTGGMPPRLLAAAQEDPSMTALLEWLTLGALLVVPALLLWLVG